MSIPEAPYAPVWAKEITEPERVPVFLAFSVPYIHCSTAPAPSYLQLLIYGDEDMLHELSPEPSKSVGKVWTAPLVVTYETSAVVSKLLN